MKKGRGASGACRPHRSREHIHGNLGSQKCLAFGRSDRRPYLRDWAPGRDCPFILLFQGRDCPFTLLLHRRRSAVYSDREGHSFHGKRRRNDYSGTLDATSQQEVFCTLHKMWVLYTLSAPPHRKRSKLAHDVHARLCLDLNGRFGGWLRPSWNLVKSYDECTYKLFVGVHITNFDMRTSPRRRCRQKDPVSRHDVSFHVGSPRCPGL